jgi:hypothetical protein
MKALHLSSPLPRGVQMDDKCGLANIVVGRHGARPAWLPETFSLPRDLAAMVSACQVSCVHPEEEEDDALTGSLWTGRSRGHVDREAATPFPGLGHAVVP